MDDDLLPLEKCLELFPELARLKQNRCAMCGCDYQGNLSQHHIFPSRHFNGKGFKIPLCRNGGRECHNKIELAIRQAEKLAGRALSPVSYCILTVRFLYGDLNLRQPTQGSSKKLSYTNKPRILNRAANTHFQGAR